ncbi:MAG TPA: M28 family peptidase [Planctomycetes bacterium]|nr:M28 family peptidase [Fuerstiella sp.]HIK93611.1 M28 family peptidase [Planctomycetota bacterium]
MNTDIERIWQHVEWIAAEPRYAESDRLEQCRAYCERHLTECGWTVQRRHFSADDQMLRSMNGINLVARRNPQAVASSSVFVLGAHLDSRENTPGADDNASAVAVLLEIARLLGEAENAAIPPGVDLELVVFDLEEQGMLGGAFHAETCLQQGISLTGMVSLEMLGYCSHVPGSQTLPEGLQGIYPDVGNFIAVVGNQNSGDLIQHFSDAFQLVDRLPRESLQVPDNGNPLPPTRLSDHSPFWDAGYPALMITDTSFMRNPHYHEPSDTPETLDRDFLHKVAEGVLNAVSALTGQSTGENEL